MAWNRLTIDDLRLVLAEDEVEKLNERSLADDKFQVVIQEHLDMVSDAFRGALQSKGYEIDSRDHYTCSSYKTFILNYARWEIWTRFPMTDDYALSEPRKKLYEEAAALLKDPSIGVDPVEPSPTPDPDDLPPSPDSYHAISMPWLKMPPVPFDTGFAQTMPWPRWWW